MAETKDNAAAKPFKQPISARLLKVIGVLTIIAGALSLMAGFSDDSKPTEMILSASGICVGVFFFGFGKVVDYLALIAHNSQNVHRMLRLYP